MGFAKPLTKRLKKKLVRIAWRQLEGFIMDWQESPYKWRSERDVQVEIASRIKSAYKEHQREYSARYTKNSRYRRFILPGFEKGQTYSRVNCEPPVFQNKKGKEFIYRPDIVIWDNPKDPPEEQKTKNDPMLWVCEIKYRRPWKADDSERKHYPDIDKLRFLLKRKQTKYACWLHMHFKRANAGDGLHKKAGRNRKFRTYWVELPFLQQQKKEQ